MTITLRPRLNPPVFPVSPVVKIELTLAKSLLTTLRGPECEPTQERLPPGPFLEAIRSQASGVSHLRDLAQYAFERQTFVGVSTGDDHRYLRKGAVAFLTGVSIHEPSIVWIRSHFEHMMAMLGLPLDPSGLEKLSAHDISYALRRRGDAINPNAQYELNRIINYSIDRNFEANGVRVA